MVLSELIANADLVDTAARTDAAATDQSAQRLNGQKLVDGMGAGVAVFHQPRITIEHTVADDTEAERHRVYAAFDKMREQLHRMQSSSDFGVRGKHEEGIETSQMFALSHGRAHVRERVGQDG